MQFYASPEAERVALRRAAARSGCSVHGLKVKSATLGAPASVVSTVTCTDGWQAAKFLLALGVEDARTPGAKKLADEIRDGADDETFARALQAYVKAHVRFVPEEGEEFESPGYTLRLGEGDCDAHFRLVYAVATAGGLRAGRGILYHGADAPPEKQGPAHAVTVLELGGAWVWCETTVDADFGEPPNDAARRLGLTSERSDIATEVAIMTEDELPPVPQGFRERNDPAQVMLDGEALQRLGFLDASLPACGLADPTISVLRLAVIEFQRVHGLVEDGLLGSTTRLTIAHALQEAGTEGFGYPGIGDIITAPAGASADLSDTFLQNVIAMTARFQAKGAKASAVDFFRVWNAESGIKNIPNGLGAPFGGFNQMGPQERKNAGFTGTFAEWLALSPEDQLPFIERYYVSATLGHFERMLDAPALYLLNFAPAFGAHAAEPDFVLFRRDPNGPEPSAPEANWKIWRDAHKGDPYAFNRGFDRRRDGTIRVGDLKVALDGAAKSSRYLDVERRVKAMGGGSAPGSSSGTGTVVASVLVTLVAAGGLAWWAFKS